MRARNRNASVMCTPGTRFTLVTSTAATLLATVACTQLPSWQKLLTAKILQQYPGYEVQPAPDGGVIVRRPGLGDVPVDVTAIARFCQRGPKDCAYATDQMLLELNTPPK